jgi:hypothetical protein
MLDEVAACWSRCIPSPKSPGSCFKKSKNVGVLNDPVHPSSTEVVLMDAFGRATKHIFRTHEHEVDDEDADE